MASSLHDPRYERLIKLLVQTRRDAKLTQRDVAAKLKQPPSYVAKIESCQRRIDLIELIDMLEAIGVKPITFLNAFASDLRGRR